MHNYFHKKTSCRWIGLVLSISIFIGGLKLPIPEKASAADNNEIWAGVVLKPGDNEFNENQETIKITNDKIVQVGTHTTAINGDRYATKDYWYVTTDMYNLNILFTEGANAAIKRSKLENTHSSVPQGNGTTKSTYIMTRKNFMNAVTDLGVTATDLINAPDGKYSVYLNTIYEVYVNDKPKDNWVYGRQEMLAAGVKYFGEPGWSLTTKKRIKDYYNYEYTLSASNTYDVKVVAVDENENVLKTFTLTDKQKYGMYSQGYTYTLPEKVIDIAGKGQYTFQNMYKYSYEDRSTNANAGVGYTDTTGTIKFESMPDVKDVLTIKFLFDSEPENYWVNVIAVDTEGNRITELQENKDVKFEDIFTFKVGTSRYTLNNKYNYQKKYYLKYVDRDPEKNIITTMQPGPDINYPMPDAKGSVQATFCLVYDIGPVPSIPPTPTPVGPTPTPGLPTPTPFIPPVVTPMPAVEYSEFTDVVNTGVIRADVRGGEKFVAQLGVATTESLFGEVAAKEYLLGYHFVKKVGIEYYTVKVKKNYILSWKTATPEAAGGGKIVTETVTREREVTVPREYGYWEIENLECYKIDNAVLKNYALPGGSVTIYPNYSYYSPPSVTYYHNENKDYHILPPKEKEEGITLPTQTLSNPADPTRKPTIPMEQFYSDANYKALTQTGKIKVRSDSLVFNGREVMSGGIVERDAPDVDTSAIPQCYSYIDSNVLYKNNQIIEATKKNGTYPSSGTITYTSIARVGSAKPDKPQYSIDGINTVVIHTPVICNPSITADNDKYVQLLNPTKDCVQLVLDPDPALSDFTVKISNIGFHSGKQGYFTRDFSYALRDASLSYIASTGGLLRNEVKFPFDVYVDIGNDNLQINDDYIKAGTWVVIGRASPRFYLSAWTKEGTYRVYFRTVAVNGLDHINQDEVFANTQLSNYVATESVDVEVSGRIYGLNVYDISDYPMWEEAFRVPNSNDLKKNVSSYPKGTDKTNYNKLYAYTYSVGTNNQYGIDTGRNIKYTFPLVNGSHPFYKNQGILKTGYLVRFSLDTIGSMFSDVCSVLIKPSFYFVDKDGKNRKAVDLYYAESINGKSKHLVKVGGALDQTNIKKVMTGDLNLGIPTTELKQTAALRGIRYGDFIANRDVMFNFSDIRLNDAFRTYVGQDYTAEVKALSSYGDVLSSGITQEDASKAMQRWYGQYYVPNEAHAVAKDFDVMDYADKYGVDYGEDFWLTDGYIIVNFSIETIDESRSRRLSYTNAFNYMNNGNCSMWIMEGPALSKASYKGPTFNFYAGDFIVYYADKRMSDDYTTGVIY